MSIVWRAWCSLQLLKQVVYYGS